MKLIYFFLPLLLANISCGGSRNKDFSVTSTDRYGVEVQEESTSDRYVMAKIQPFGFFKLDGVEFKSSSNGHPLIKILTNPERDFFLKDNKDCIKKAIGSKELMSLKGRERSSFFNMIADSTDEYVEFDGGVDGLEGRLEKVDIRFQLLSIRPDGSCTQLFKKPFRLDSEAGREIRAKIKRSTLEEEIINGGDLVLMSEVLHYQGQEWVHEEELISRDAGKRGGVLLTNKGSLLIIQEEEKKKYKAINVNIGITETPVYTEVEIEKNEGVNFLKNTVLGRDLIGNYKLSNNGVGEFKFAFFGDVYLMVHTTSSKTLIPVEMSQLEVVVSREGRKSEHHWDEVFNTSERVKDGVVVTGDFKESRVVYFTFKRPLRGSTQLIGNLKVYASEGWE